MQPFFLANDPHLAETKLLKSDTNPEPKGSPDKFDRYDLLFIFQIVGATIGAVVSFWNFRNLVIQEQFIQKTKSYLQERQWIIWVAAILIIALAVGIILFFRMLNERNSIDAQREQAQTEPNTASINSTGSPVSHTPTLVSS